MIFFLILYPVFTTVFLTRLLRSVQTIEDAASGLSFGKSDFQRTATVIPEFNSILSSIEDVMRDAKEKTIFADNLKKGKLDAATSPDMMKTTWVVLCWTFSSICFPYGRMINSVIGLRRGSLNLSRYCRQQKI